MVQKNRDYWEERQVKREAKAFSNIQDVEKEYKIALEKAKQNINKELSRIGTTYMKDNNLSYHDALKLLKGDEYKVWKKDLHEYMAEYNKLLKTAPLEAKKLYLEIETLSARSRMSHLDSLKAQVDMEMVKLIFGIEDSAKNGLASVYRDTFIEVTKDLGINAIVSRDKIKAVLDRPWSGANFSERLWSNTDKLAQTVKQEIVNGMIQGINLQTMTKRISERFETAKKNDVERLLRTEVNYTLNQATLDGYKEAGIEKYEFSATLDSRTSQICSELNGEIFEIKKIAVGLNYPPMHPRCFDKNTEVYTNNGWKLFKDLKDKDLVYTINPENLEPEWQQPINYISYKYQGSMISFKNSRFDLVVTPNHSILVQNMDNSVKDKSWKLKEASTVGRKSKHKMFAGLNWNGVYKKYEILAGEKVEIETYLKFMAYWLSDGSCTLDRNSYNIKIAQCNNNWMYDELKKFPFKIYKCKESLMVHNKKLGEELIKFGKATTKFIPDNIKELSPELIKIFLLAYSKADGTIKKGKNWKGYKFNDSISFFTSSDKLSSDLGELILKAGGRPSYYLNKCAGKEKEFKNGIYTINNDVWVINWNTQLCNYLYNMKIIDIEYDDYVYCVEVPKYHTLLVRRNGKICWSGNCRSTTIPIIDYESLVKQGRDELGEKDITFGDKETLTDYENKSINKFKETKTIEEAENYAKNILGLKQTNYSGMHIDVANTINLEISKLCDIFEGINNTKFLKGVVVVKAKDLPPGTVAAYYPLRGTVAMKNVSYKTTLKRMEEDAISGFKAGWCSTSSAEHVIRHELGHAVQHWLTDNDTEKLLKIDRIRMEINNKCELGYWDYRAPEETKKKAGEYLSYYGMRNNGEFIAESIAEYMSGNPRATAKRVVDILLDKE
ncbi:minor capsid protein [Fusobacterium animalis]|uniref:minor capsid protein n=1 Tax=Fusobacterium animalis TaxID=76859 RepID=UPI0032456F30